MDKINIINYIIRVLGLIILVVGIFFLIKVYNFEHEHKLTIQNVLSVDDQINGRTLEEINTETYQNYFTLTESLTRPFLVFTIIVLGLLFGLSEFKCILLERMIK